MNKILLLIGFVLAVITANAQFEKGQKLLSGSINTRMFNTTEKNTSNQSKTFSLAVSPSFGKFTSKNTIVSWGFSVGFGNTNYVNGTIENKENSTNYGLNYGFTKLFTVGKNFYFALGLGAGASVAFSNRDASTIFPESRKSNSFNVGVGLSPSLMFPLNKKVLISTGFSNMAALEFNLSNTIDKNIAGTVIRELNTTNLSFVGTSNVSSPGIFLGATFIL
jgi:hypothetical protein